MQYLGYVTSDNGIVANPGKVKAVKDFQVPANLNQLRSFLSLPSYYRRFVKNFSKVANPLFALTKKDTAYVCVDRIMPEFLRGAEETVDYIPYIGILKFHQGISTSCRCLRCWLGCSLITSTRILPICFSSRTLQKHECNYGVTGTWDSLGSKALQVLSV